MKLKLVTAILVLAALFSVVLWRVDRFVYGNRMAWAESQARSQVSSVSQAINAEINSGRRMLSTVTNDTFRPESTNWRSFQPYYSLALMTSQNGLMTITRLVSKSDSPAASWTSTQLTQYLGFLGKDLDSRGAVILRSFKDPQKRRHVALIFAGGGSAYILVGSGENFQALIDSQKGSMSSFSIVASDGLTISHAVPDYIGNVMSDSTLLKEVRTKGAAQGVGIFKQGKTSVFGMYEKVAGTNSYVISTVALDDLLRGRLSLAWQFVFLVLGFSLLGAALYFWYEKKQAHLAATSPAIVSAPLPEAPVVAAPMKKSAPVSKPAASSAAGSSDSSSAALPQVPANSTSPTKGAPAKTASPNTNPMSANPILPSAHSASVVVTNSELVAPSAPRTALPEVTTHPEEPSAEKSDAYRQVASALGQEMRAPIASILGFSQMVLSKTQDPEVVQAVESILREARSSRDVLEKLQTFSGERNSAKFDGKIETAISQALKKFESLFKDKGVTVEKDFGDTSTWPLSVDDMTKVFENLFSNAVEAMERMQEKRLKISVNEDAVGLRVLIMDSGEGISPENLEKIFDPFYTTRSFAHHVGLGLPVVYGILKEHHAEIQIKSSRGQGTQVEIHILPIAKTAASRAEGKPSVTSAPLAPPMAASERSTPASAANVATPTAAAANTTPETPATPAAPAAPKLTDVNVDKLLDFSSDELPLEFLDGFGFGNSPAKKEVPPAPVTPVSPSAATEPVVPADLKHSDELEALAEEAARALSPEEETPTQNLEATVIAPEVTLERDSFASPESSPASTSSADEATVTAAPVVAPPPAMPPPKAPPSMPPPQAFDLQQPPQEAAQPQPATEVAQPPKFVLEEDDEVTDPLYQIKAEVIEEEFVAVQKPSLPKRAPAILPDEPEEPEEMQFGSASQAFDNEPTVIAPPSLTIDPPKPRAQTSSSPLDSYKVEIRRPGKRT